MKTLNVRPARQYTADDAADDKIFKTFLGGISMNVAGEKITKIFHGENLLESLGRQRQAPVTGYIFEAVNGGKPVAVATSTHYARARLRGLGLICASDTANYIAELRVDPHAERRARAQWKKRYREIVAATPEPIFTVVFDENADAVRSFSRGREGLVYKKIYSYSVFVVIRVGTSHFGEGGVSAAPVTENGEWVLERPDGPREVFQLSSIEASQLSELRPVSLESSEAWTAKIIGIIDSKSEEVARVLGAKKLLFLRIRATLYEVHLVHDQPRITILASLPDSLDLEML